MKFSIIMPVYNAEKYVNKGIMSIVNQTYNNWELIIIDDGSKDRTLEQIRTLHEQDDRVRYVSFSRNFGKEAGIYA